jgi:S1-C subfamily serine protease
VHLGVRMDAKAAAPLVVGSIDKGSPAEAAGLQPGDEITSIAGHPVTSLTELVYWIGKEHKGDSATITVRRAGKTLDLRAAF